MLSHLSILWTLLPLPPPHCHLLLPSWPQVELHEAGSKGHDLSPSLLPLLRVFVIEVSAQMTFCPSGLIDVNHTTISVISSQNPHHTLLYSFSGTFHCFQDCSHCLQKVNGKPGSHESSMPRVKNVKTLKNKSQDLLIASRRHSLVSSVQRVRSGGRIDCVTAKSFSP